MNDSQLDDLKQFIATTVSQVSADMATKEDIRQLIAKIDDLELKVDTISDTLNEQLEGQDGRLASLEQKFA